MARGTRTALAGILAICFLAVPAGASAASPADWLYEPTTFTEIDLELPPASFEALEDREYDDYVEAQFSMAETNGVPGETGPFTTPITVGVALKGSKGSRRDITEKAALKVKFNEFVKGQTFLGLKKMTLNNMVQDPSLTHEVLAYQAFHDMSVPAPNTGYSYLWVNGESYGLHLNLESLDDIALEKRFGPFEDPPQHLYEGESGADVSTEEWRGMGIEKWEVFETDEGDEDDKADLEALLAAVEGSTGSFSERVAAHADLEQMTRMWMTEKFIQHWDGYSGIPPVALQPNNYYLYSDPDGVFQMIPWGTDQTWELNLGFDVEFGEPGGALFGGCVGDTTGCLPLYHDAGEAALTELTTLKLDTAARCTAASVLPWREYELDESATAKLPDYDLQETLEEQDDMREFIADRPAELADYLGVAAPPSSSETLPCPPLRPIGGFKPPPPDEPEEPGGGGDGGGGSDEKSKSPDGSQSPPSGQSQGQPPVADPLLPPAATKPHLGRREIRANAIGLQLKTSVAGKLTLVGTFGGGEEPAVACRGRGRASAAGTANLSCRFTNRFKRRLELGPAFVRLTATLTTAAGDSQSRTKTLRIPAR